MEVIVIGNGFDLHKGLGTSYQMFKEELQQDLEERIKTTDL